MATKIDAWFTICGGTCGKQHGYHMVAMLSGKLLCDGNCPAYTHTGTCRHIDEVKRELGIPTTQAPTPISHNVIRGRDLYECTRCSYTDCVDFTYSRSVLCETKAPTPISQAAREYAESLDFS